MDFGSVRALDGLDLEIPEGAIFGFLGPNGAGKTTTLRILLGLLDPAAGRRWVLGLDVAADPERVRASVGALLEHHGLYERLSAWNNLEFAGRIVGMTPAERRARSQELLERFGLWDRRDENAGRFSKGMKQKLAIARAIYHRPRIVFLDEPTNGLDPTAAVELRNDLIDLARRDGVTVFVTTHNLAEVEKLCDLVGIIGRGRLRAFGTLESLRRAAGPPHLEFAGPAFPPAASIAAAVSGVRAARIHGDRLIVELHDEAPAAPVVSALVQAGYPVEEMRRVVPSLENVYLATMQEDA